MNDRTNNIPTVFEQIKQSLQTECNASMTHKEKVRQVVIEFLKDLDYDDTAKEKIPEILMEDLEYFKKELTLANENNTNNYYLQEIDTIKNKIKEFENSFDNAYNMYFKGM